MTGTIDIRLSAEHPDKKLDTHYVFAGSPSAPRITGIPEKIGTWEIENVYVNVAYPDNTMLSVEAVNTDGVYVATLRACDTIGIVDGGFEVVVDGIDENGENFQGLCLGVGDLEVLPRLGQSHNMNHVTFFRILSSMPSSPNRGDATVISGVLKWYDGSSWMPFGGNESGD